MYYKVTPIYTFGSADPRFFVGSQSFQASVFATPYIYYGRKNCLSRFWDWCKKFFHRKKNKLTVVPSTKTYLGKSYTSFGGADIKFWIEFEDGTAQCMAEIQSISIQTELPKGEVRGTLISVIFDTDPIAALPKPVKNIRLKSANEYGQIAECCLKNVRFTRMNWAGSIDDIVTEVHYEFEANEFETWHKPTTKLSQLSILEDR